MTEPVSPERQYVEDVSMALENMGLSRMVGRVFAWLLICEPRRQSSGELASALGVSKGSISTATRLLESTGLIRRVAVPGIRGDAFEMVPMAFLHAMDPARIRVFRELMDEGLALVGGESESRADRLRETRDFYAFVERELATVVERFKATYEAGREGHADG